MHIYQILYIISGSLWDPGSSNMTWFGLALVTVLFFSVWRHCIMLPWLALNSWASCLRPLGTGIIGMSHHVYCHNFYVSRLPVCVPAGPIGHPPASAFLPCAWALGVSHWASLSLALLRGFLLHHLTCASIALVTPRSQGDITRSLHSSALSGTQ